MASTSTSVYRFEFTDGFKHHLKDTFVKRLREAGSFGRRGQGGVGGREIKQLWMRWKEANEDLIQSEVARMHAMGYTGDVEDKMYKSVRYYWIKRGETSSPSTTTTIATTTAATTTAATTPGRQYIRIGEPLLTAMKHHYAAYVVKHAGNTEAMRPELAFDDFCNTRRMEIRDEICDMLQDGRFEVCGGTDDAFLVKLKKTYKNILQRAECTTKN